MSSGLLPPRLGATQRDGLAYVRRVQLYVAALAVVAAVVVWDEGYRWIFLAGAAACVWTYFGLRGVERRVERQAPDLLDAPGDPVAQSEYRRRVLPLAGAGLVVFFAAVGLAAGGWFAAAFMGGLGAVGALIALALLARR